MKKSCKNCNHCYTEYMIGGYPTPVCTLHGYLEELDNPYHNIGEKCPDYTYPRVKISFDTMINEIHLIEDILGENDEIN